MLPFQRWIIAFAVVVGVVLGQNEATAAGGTAATKPSSQSSGSPSRTIRILEPEFAAIRPPIFVRSERWVLPSEIERKGLLDGAWRSMTYRTLTWSDPVSGKTLVASYYGGGGPLAGDQPLALSREAIVSCYVHGLDGDFTPAEVYRGTGPDQGLASGEALMGFAGRFPLTVQFISDDRQTPLIGTLVVLYREDGLPLGPRGYGGFTRAANHAGTVTYGLLRPGVYWIEARQEAVEYGQLDYISSPARVRVEVAPPRTDLTVRLSPVQPSPSEVEQRWRFLIRGVVRDQSGRPVAGAEIKACSVAEKPGGLHKVIWPDLIDDYQWTRSPGTLTAADGSYVLRFQPELTYWESATQSYVIGRRQVAILVRKPGYYEENLCHDGRLGIAGPPALGFSSINADVPIVRPNEPYTLNFTIRPAVTLYGRIIRGTGPDAVYGGNEIGGLEVHCANSRGAPLVGRPQFLSDGGFRIDDLPCGSLVFIGRNSSIIGQTQVGTINCDQPGRYTILIRSSRSQQPVNSVEVVQFTESTKPADDRP